MTLPKCCVIHISGIPATGKSKFCKFLVREHGFAHYDLERFPLGWPHPELNTVWESSRSDFVRQIRRYHERCVVDWGFPISFRPLVDELRAAGVALVWFAGDVRHAREIFVNRGGIDPAQFDRQVVDIENAGLPEGLGARVINGLSPTGRLRKPEAILRELFRR